MLKSDLAVTQAIRAKLRHRKAEVVPFRKSQVRIDGEIDGGGRLEVGFRWPGSFFETTTFIVEDGGRCTVNDNFKIGAGGRSSSGPEATSTSRGGSAST